MSQAKCQVLIQSKCAPGERGFVTIYDAPLPGEDGRTRYIDEKGLSMRVAEAFTSLNQSPNAPIEQRNNRTIVRVPYRAGAVSTKANGDARASEALATESAFAQLLDELSKPPAAPDAGPHPAELAAAKLAAENDALRAELADKDAAIASAVSVTSELAAKDAEIAALKEQLAAKPAEHAAPALVDDPTPATTLTTPASSQ
jgi:hypothetical protein